MTNIGIVGYGEAGPAFARMLAGQGAVVWAFDKAWGESASGPPLTDHTCDHNIRFCSLDDLLASADIVLSTVTTDAALDAARACVADLRAHQYYCDLNSTAPAIKLELDNLIGPTGAMFVEGAILGAVGVTGGRTKILLGGFDARTLSGTLNKFGLETTAYSKEIGKASTSKMLRSVFSKGMEALVIELLLAGRKAGVEDDLWQEITALFTKNSFGDVAGNWVCSHAVAHERRFHEMVQVADLLAQMKLDAIMTDATLAFFRRSTNLKLSRNFARKPDQMNEVIEALMRQTPAPS